MKLTQELARAWRRLTPRRKGSLVVTGILLLLVGVLVSWEALTPRQQALPPADGNLQVGGIVEEGTPQQADGSMEPADGLDGLPPTDETDEVMTEPEPGVEVEAPSPQLDPADVSWHRPVTAKPVQGYGIAYHPVYGDYRLHGGWTYSLHADTPVTAAAAGTVTEIQPAGALGWEVWVDHGGGLRTAYNGLGSVSVAVGDLVEASAVLGTVGKGSAASVGQPLFFALLQNDDPLDPAKYVE